LTGFIDWDRPCCNFETAVGDEFYTLAASGQYLPDDTKGPMTNVQPKAGVGCGEITNRTNRERCGARCLPHLWLRKSGCKVGIDLYGCRHE